MRTGSLFFLRVRKRLCVSVLGGKLSIYFLLNSGYFLIYIYIYINIYDKNKTITYFFIKDAHRNSAPDACLETSVRVCFGG